MPLSHSEPELPDPLAAAPVVLRASHQFPGGKGDVRDDMVQMIARDAKVANVGLDIQVYPGASPFKPEQQWNAMVNGPLDMTLVPLDYASRPARLSCRTPGSVGGMVSKRGCILEPSDVKGLKFRAAGPTFAQMWQSAAASIVSIPSNAFQTGVAEGTDTGMGSFLSFRLYEQAKCMTASKHQRALVHVRAGAHVEEKLRHARQEAAGRIARRGQEGAEILRDKAESVDEATIKAYKDHGVEVKTLSDAQYNDWLDIAKKSSYVEFAKDVPDGKKLIDEALSVK